MLALEFGRLLMEAGAGAGDVEEIAVQVAAGLGASRADLRVGYASLAITIGVGSTGRIRDVDKGIQDRLAFLARQTPGEFLRAFFQFVPREQSLREALYQPGQDPPTEMASKPYMSA